MDNTPWDPFLTFSDTQRAQVEAFEREARAFNLKINLISRDTEALFFERHLLHALALSYRTFPAEGIVVDWGTGGGLPVIPLAIRFPDVTFHAVDAVGKKIRVVQAIARRLGLDNLQAWHGRAEVWPGRAHYSVSRATAPLLDLWQWHVACADPVVPARETTDWPPGLYCLKGGDLEAEVAALEAAFPDVVVNQWPLTPLLGRPYFNDKVIVGVTGGKPANAGLRGWRDGNPARAGLLPPLFLQPVGAHIRRRVF